LIAEAPVDVASPIFDTDSTLKDGCANSANKSPTRHTETIHYKELQKDGVCLVLLILE
jgi:hypothetical protein